MPLRPSHSLLRRGSWGLCHAKRRDFDHPVLRARNPVNEITSPAEISEIGGPLVDSQQRNWYQHDERHLVRVAKDMTCHVNHKTSAQLRETACFIYYGFLVYLSGFLRSAGPLACVTRGPLVVAKDNK